MTTPTPAYPPEHSPRNSDQIRSASWTAPTEATVRNAWIVCPFDPPWHDVTATPAMLASFVQLAAQPDDAIADFAKRWGQLHMCDEHVLPSSHLRYSVHAPEMFARCAVSESSSSSVSKTPVAAWKYWSRQAQAVLRIASNLWSNRPGDLADWEAISEEGLTAWREQMWRIAPNGPWHRRPSGEVYQESRPPYGVALTQSSARLLRELSDTAAAGAQSDLKLTYERQALSRALNEWLLLADVNLSLRWDRSAPSVELAGGSLFAALGVELMVAVSRSDALEICSSCGNPYVAQRRPRVNQRQYCPACGHGAAIRDAARAYRERKRREADQPKPPKRTRRGKGSD